MPSWPVPGMRRVDLPRFAIGMGTTTRTLRLDGRLNGPPRSANGGFASGAMAQTMGGTASVRLIRPVPLSTPLDVETDVDGTSAKVTDPNAQLVAEVRRVDPFTMTPPMKPSFAQAEVARASSPLQGVRHLLSDCVVCGPERRDGLGVTPGPLLHRSDMLAAPFVPHERDATDGAVHPEALWGALDCPSYPAASLLGRRLGLLGTLAAHQHRDVFVGERLVAVGWTIDRRRRSTQTASALLDERGDVVASARAVWIELKHQWLVRLAGRIH